MGYIDPKPFEEIFWTFVVIVAGLTLLVVGLVLGLMWLIVEVF